MRPLEELEAEEQFHFASSVSSGSTGGSSRWAPPFHDAHTHGPYSGCAHEDIPGTGPACVIGVHASSTIIGEENRGRQKRSEIFSREAKWERDAKNTVDLSHTWFDLIIFLCLLKLLLPNSNKQIIVT